MDLLLLSPVKTQKPEQLQLGAINSMNRVPYQLVNDLQLSEDSDTEENFSVEKSEQAVKGSFCLIENMPSLDDSTERPTVHQSMNTKRAEVKQLGDRQRIEPGRMAECNAYDLANDLQLSDDSDLEDNLMKSKGGAEVIQNCGPSSRAIHRRDNNEFGAFLPAMQNLQEVPTNTDSGPYSLENDLDLSEDSDSDDDFDAVLPNTVGSCRIENTPSLYNGRLQATQNFPKELMSEKMAYGKIEHDTAGIRVAPKEMSHTKDQTSGGKKTLLKDSSRNRLGQQYERKPSECQVVPSNPQELSSPISFRKGYGTSYQTVLQPLVPSTPTQPRQTIIMASDKLVKPAIDPSIKPIAANSDVKAGDRQRIYKLPKQTPQQEITRKSPQKRDQTNSEVVNSFNGRHITKPTKVAAIFSNGQSNKNFNGSSPDEKPPAPSLDPLPENFTLPVARKVRTSNFSKQQIESQISRGKILLQKTTENQLRCEDPAKPRKQIASDQKNGKSAKNIAQMSQLPQIKQKTTDETEKSLEAKVIKPEVNRIIKTDRKEAKQRNGVRGAHKGLLKELGENKANTEDQSKLHKRKAREMLSSSSTSPMDEMSVGNITQVPEQPRKKQKICKDIEKSGEDSSMIKPQMAKDRIADNCQKKLPKGSRSEEKGEASRSQLQKTHTPKSDDKCLKNEQSNPTVAGDYKQDSGLEKMVSDRIPQTAKDRIAGNRQKKLPKGSRSEEERDASRSQLQKTYSPESDDKCLKSEQRNPMAVEDCKLGLGQILSDRKHQTAKDRIADSRQKKLPKGSRREEKGEVSRLQLQKTHTPKSDDKWVKNEQRNPVVVKDCKQDSGLGQMVNDKKPQTAKDRIADNRQKKLPKGSRCEDKGEASGPYLQKTYTPKCDDKCLKSEQRNPMVAENCKQDSGLGQMVSDRKPQTASDRIAGNRQKKLPKGSRSEEKGEASGSQMQKTHPPKSVDKWFKSEQRNLMVAEDCKQDSGLGQTVSDRKPQTTKDRIAGNRQKKLPEGSRSEEKGEASGSQMQKTYSPKGDGKCPKNGQKNPIITENCKHDPGVEQQSDREKFKIVRREYIQLLESVKKPAHLVLELKKVLDRKVVSGTEKEIMAIKEEILLIGKQLRSESFQNQKRKLKQLEDQLQLLKYNIRNRNGTLEL